MQRNRRRFISRLGAPIAIVLAVVFSVACSSPGHAVVLVDPYLASVTSAGEYTRWRRAASSEGLRLKLVRLGAPDVDGPFFDQMREALASGTEYGRVFVSPALLREAELLQELIADRVNVEIVVLGLSGDSLPDGLRGVGFDRASAYRELGIQLALASGQVQVNGADGVEARPIVFFGMDSPVARGALDALRQGAGEQGVDEVWYSSVPTEERLIRDIEMRSDQSSVAVFMVGAAGPTALRISAERSLPSVFEAVQPGHSHLVYGIELSFAPLISAALRGEASGEAVLRRYRN